MTAGTVTGSCLCGGVRYEVRGPFGQAGYCHCVQCRKAGGTAFGSNAPVARGDVAFKAGEDLLTSFESSPGKHRVFCSRCGSPVYSRRDADPGLLRLRLGTLEEDPGLRPAAHAWTGEKAPWHRLPDDGLPRLVRGAPDSRQPRIRLRAEAPSSPEARTLIAALDADLAQSYPPEVIFGLHDDDHDPARMVFLVARRGDRAVACGALRSLAADLGEVKRMYVVPQERGEGLSRLLLAAIEAIAIGRGHDRLRLETGNRSPASLSLYRSSGFREIPAYGEYAGNAYSVCFEKEL